MKAVTLHFVPPSAPRRPLSTTQDEAELLVAIVKGEAGWQRRSFEAFHGLVHGLVLKSLGPNAEVSDLVSDVFLMFFESAHRIREASAVRSYLVSITMNRVRREVRRRKHRKLLYFFTGGPPPEVAHRAGPDDPKAKAALIHLSRIVDELNADDRAAFVLSSLEGMDLEEIGNVLGVSHSTAKRRVRRANEHVRKRVSRNALLSDYIREKTLRRNG